MPRGGARPGSGGRSTWKHGKTKTIRVPDILAERILEIARVLDRDDVEVLERRNKIERHDTRSKVIDLTGVAIRSTKDGPAVYLADLVRAGYKIEPAQLTRNLNLQRGTSLSSLKNEINEAIGHLKQLESEV